MAEKRNDSTGTTAPARPTITLPPRPSMDTLFTGGFSPGPMTLVSSFFSDNYPDSDCRSFSQLLAGAMGSPIGMPNFYAESPIPNTNSSSMKDDGVDSNRNSGFKQSRPMNLMVARSPMFTLPPGLSPSGFLNSPGGFFSPQSPFGMSHQQALAQVTAQALAAQSQMHMQAQYQTSSTSAPTETLVSQPSLTPDESFQQRMPSSTSDSQSAIVEVSELSHSDKKYQPPLAVDKPSDDGYNWRKYGQKPIKGSEYPRSYYKCTHPNCPVKKKVERSSEGQITEIIYKGEHNHDLPPPNKRAKDIGEQTGGVSSQVKPDRGSQAQDGNMTKFSEVVPIHPVPWSGQESALVEPAEQPAESESGEAGDVATKEETRDDDEPNPKRRHTDVGTSEVALPHKTVTEPKIIVQTRSEVDLLDDGYRWRKYGQKVVKGNPHPRSYYKCTSAGCNVRKHVERAAADAKAVITTYEGKHNHDVPAARNSGQSAANNSTHTRRSTNVPAHKLGQLALISGLGNVWIGECPEAIEPFVLADMI